MQAAITINSISEEYEYIRNQNCDCGGDFKNIMQKLIFDENKNPFDLLTVECKNCKKQVEFLFDCSSFFGKIE